MAAKQFAMVEADPSAEDTLKTMNAALLASSEGDWIQASEKLREILEKDADNYVVRSYSCEAVVVYILTTSFKAVNNLSVALLSQGKLKEVREQLNCRLNLVLTLVCERVLKSWKEPCKHHHRVLSLRNLSSSTFVRNIISFAITKSDFSLCSHAIRAPIDSRIREEERIAS
jgi:hypothetical protein